MNAAILPTMVASDQGRIPVLAIGPYLDGDPGVIAPLARAVARASASSIQMRAEAHFDGKVAGMISAALRPAQSKPGTFSIARRCAISSRALASA